METKEEILHAASLRVIARLEAWNPIGAIAIKAALIDLLPHIIEDKEE